ncbi:PREDICTED: uncharacterized protein LOC107334699 isoform X2 [Acropora digitifera]|uniref:uncharacterized protein LOC107334699 isoform X2 n=1 Tax=Acropora digitifera TaxID=70779 RepID=UPI00077ACDDE|nr:PREDICTED: uncharacterized protein LOC107334699 isoform X2 [Acropora digitifera]
MNQLGEMCYGTATDNQRFMTIACPAVSENDLNKTRLATQFFFACGTGAFYLVAVALSICGVYFANCARLCTSRGTFFVFFVGALVASTNVFTYSGNMDVDLKLYFRCSVALIVGIVYISFGAALFFKLREEGANEQALGGKQPFMGAVVGLVTFPLFALEILFLALALHKSLENSNREQHIQRILIILGQFLFLFQKPVQLAIYLCLRRAIPRAEFRKNAQFYFRIISFFNLIEWLDSQVNVDADLLLSGIRSDKSKHVWSVLMIVYKTLIIDYRLLCCILFLEHSLEIEDNQNQQGEDHVINDNMADRDELTRCCGFFAGAACLLAPLLCSLYFVGDVTMGASVQLSMMIVQIAIVLSGLILLRMNNFTETGEHNGESSAVKIMVCCFGAVGFLCWIMHAAIAGYWAVTSHYRSDIGDRALTSWDSLKFGVRGLSTAFIMYLFTKVNAQAFPQQNPDVKSNHFVVPVIMFGILSTFAETLVDQYVGAIDSAIRCETKEQIVKILLEAGLPMYLGFLIHVFLHFFIIETKLGKIPRCLRRNRGRDSYAEYQDAVEEL